MANITGTAQADILPGTSGDDLIRGRAGNDDLDGQAGNDRLKGGRGEDRITDGAGQDIMWGGNDADTFVLVADGEQDVIKDWESQDTLDLSDWGVSNFADLAFTDLANGQVRIQYGTEVLVIRGDNGAALSESDFSASDFILAPPPPPQVIDFETLSIPDPQFGAPIAFVDPGHAGFNWSENFYFVEQDDLTAAGRTAGSDNRTGGGNVFATNGFGQDVDFSAAQNFDLEQMTVGAVYNDGLTLRVVAMDDGQFVGQQTFTLDTTGSQTIALDDQIFDDVDQVVFQTYGGSLNPTYGVAGGDTTHFYLDDVVVA